MSGQPPGPSGADDPIDGLLAALARAPDVVAPASRIGSSLGKYQLEAVLGRGGMGVVYAARDATLGRRVALKLLDATGQVDTQRRARFLREARAGASVTAANIAAVYEVGEQEDQIFLAMELVAGRTLRERLREGQMPIADVIRVGRGVARGLVRAHAAGVVHRDIKPENVMVDADGEPKILDFGLAKIRATLAAAAADPHGATTPGSSQEQLTEEGHLVGTPGYMSPEQAKGLAIDERTDVFSLGVLLYEMAAGRRPFAGATVMALVIAIDRDEPPPPSSFNPQGTPALDEIVRACLRKDPAARPRAEEVHAALAALDGAPPSTPGLRRVTPIRRALVLAVALLTVTAVATLLLVARYTRVAPPAKTKTPVTALPLPRIAPAARESYIAGLQMVHDANWGRAVEHFQRAVELDPNSAMAWLRYALTSQAMALSASVVHDAYRRASDGASTLDERDRLLLHALEPVLLREPADMLEAARRLAAASDRFPGDAELPNLQAYYLILAGDPEGSLRANQRALENDPTYADAWQGVGGALASLDRDGEALAALDRCQAVSPMASDCSNERMLIYDARGECAEAERYAREQVLKSSNLGAFHVEARELFALGRPIATVREMLAQGWRRLPEPRRSFERDQDEMLLAIHAGDFARALGLADAFRRAHAQDPELQTHATAALREADLLTEVGRDRDADRVAADFLARRDAWVAGDKNQMADDPSLVLARKRLRVGSITKADYEAARASFIARWRGAPRAGTGGLWLYAWARPAETHDDAVEALAARSADPTLFARTNGSDRVLFARFDAGKVSWLAGNVDEALPVLERAAATCSALDRPFEVARYRLLAAAALARRDDRPRACAMYQTILDRWGAATLPSRSVEEARARRQALGCGR